MTVLANGAPRIESFSTGGGSAIEASYFYDPNTNEYVSFHTETFEFGRNSNNISPPEFLRMINGVLGSDVHGYYCPHDFKIISIAAQADNLGFPNTTVLRLYNNGSSIETVSWPNQNSFSRTLDINADAGTISVSVHSSLGPPDHPIVRLEARWRL